ncbi:unnamed protein product [Brachionus calyciflorus]|uniref:Ig-like domain-containing protein n=1 Tax=Brachionus calyciflorus TaxID=104777 RepID=A0A813LYH1_9BILA|nr:unnamed protein product [Brachionus calyciflorus]
MEFSIKILVIISSLFYVTHGIELMGDLNENFIASNRNIKTLRSDFNRPYYIDNSSTCPVLFYTAMRVIKNCSSLNLANSNLDFLGENTLSITELILSNNNFESTLPYMQINTYATVRILDLGFNRLSEFTNDLKLIDCNLTCIKNLSLHYNLFSRIPILSPTCSNNLKFLNLSFNKNLINIDQDVNLYPTMVNLDNLDLAYCNIEYLNINNLSIFNKMPSLIYLNMTGNRIKFISPNPFLNLIYLEYLSFDPSLLECTSSLLWLKHFLLRNSKIKGIWSNGTLSTRPYEPFCFNILTNSSQNIIQSANSSFYTNIFLTTSIKTRVINVGYGKTVDLDCEQFSVPSSDLWWTFNNRVLSRTVDSDYEFIENFDSKNPQATFNKTTVLRIKNINEKLSGIYSCKALYTNVDFNQFIRNVSFIEFQVNVGANPNASSGFLTAGQIAGIVIGAIIGFLLLCLLLFLLAWCCCYKRGWCCCCCTSKKEQNESFSNKKNSLGYSSTTNSKKYLTEFSSFDRKLDGEDNGFHDLSNSKPNYVINTISSRSGYSNKNQFESRESNFEKSNEYQNNISTNITSNNNNVIMIDEYPLTTLNRGNIYNVNQNNQIISDYQLNDVNSTNLYVNKSSLNNGYLSDEGNFRIEAPMMKRYVETTEYSSNHFISDNNYDGHNEYHDENMKNEVIIDGDDEYTQQYFRPGHLGNHHNNINKLNKKYDSDV